MGDLIDWAIALAQGRHVWRDSSPRSWHEETERFFARLQEFDQVLATTQISTETEARLFQGPIADALTHTGQIAMLRRLAGQPIRGENYFKADIRVGAIGLEQPAAVFEFDS